MSEVPLYKVCGSVENAVDGLTVRMGHPNRDSVGMLPLAAFSRYLYQATWKREFNLPWRKAGLLK